MYLVHDATQWTKDIIGDLVTLVVTHLRVYSVETHLSTDITYKSVRIQSGGL
jgi:hypothetical protein